MTVTKEVTLYEASVSMPGYLPIADERFLFHSADAAWEFLAGERRSDEDTAEAWADYSDAVVTLDYLASGQHQHGNRCEDHPTNADGTGLLHASTPGFDSEHDLGLQYAVRIWGHADYPHEAGRLYGCGPCEWTCHGCGCVPGDDFAACVHCAAMMDDPYRSCEDGDCAADHEWQEVMS